MKYLIKMARLDARLDISNGIYYRIYFLKYTLTVKFKYDEFARG